MTRKILKVLKRKVAESLGWLVIALVTIAIMAAYFGIPYLVGKYLIINIPVPILEEISGEECGAWCAIVTVFITGFFMIILKLIKLVKCIIEEAKREQ